MSFRKLSFLYQTFAIFSLFFQSIYPVLYIATPIYAQEPVVATADTTPGVTADTTPGVTADTTAGAVSIVTTEATTEVPTESPAGVNEPTSANTPATKVQEENSSGTSESPSLNQKPTTDKTSNQSSGTLVPPSNIDLEISGEALSSAVLNKAEPASSSQPENAEIKESISDEESQAQEEKTEPQKESSQEDQDLDQNQDKQSFLLNIPWVQLGKEYSFEDSLGQTVRLVFKRIDGESGSLTAKEVELDAELQGKLRAVGQVAYDIESSMDNGSFAYDLVIDIPDSQESSSLVYAEDLESLHNEAKEVAGTAVKNGKLEAEGLDHFTIFVVVNPLPSGVTNGETCTVESSTGDCYDSLQAAIDNATNGDTISIKSDLSVTHQTTVAGKSIEINGDGHKVTANFSKTNNSNNAVFGINGTGSTTTIKNLVVDGGGSGRDLHGINVYVSNLVLIDVTIQNSENTALNINGSEVEVTNLHTSGNATKGFYGFKFYRPIELDKGSGVTRNPRLTIKGQSQHAESGSHIRAHKGTVDDTNTQYNRSGSYYTLRSAPGVPLNLIASVTDDSVTASWGAVDSAASYDYEITGHGSRYGSASATSATEEHLENGEYEIRVRAVAQSGLAGNWSPTVKFTIDYHPHPDPNSRYFLSLGGALYQDAKPDDCNGLSTCRNELRDLSSGWEMRLYQEDEPGAWNQIQSTTTDVSGKFRFSGVGEAGTYYVCEVIKPGWAQQSQNWSGTIYHLGAPNQSGETDEGPYCRKIEYDDTQSHSNSSRFGNVDTTSPSITSLKYFNSGVEVVTPADVPIVTNSIDKLTYSAQFHDGESGLSFASFVIWRADDSWGPISGSHMCNWTGTSSTSLLNGTTDDLLHDIALSKCLQAQDLPSGNYLIQHRVYDRSGYNTYGRVGSSSRQRFIIDREAPLAPQITKPESGQAFHSTPIPNEWTTVSDPSGIKQYQVAYRYDDGHSFGGSTCPGVQIDGHDISGCRDSLTNSRNHTPSDSKQGGVTIWVRAIDMAGNEGAWSEGVHYLYDKVPPTAPEITGFTDQMTETSIACGGVSNLNEITVNWSPATDNETGIKGYGYTINYPTWQENSHSYDFRNWSTSLGNVIKRSGVVNEGVSTIKVRAVDNSGLQSSWSNECKLIIDRTPPASKIDIPDGAIELESDPSTLVIQNAWDGSITGISRDDSKPDQVGIKQVSLSIQRESDNKFWNGAEWVDGTEASARVDTLDPENTGEVLVQSWLYTLPENAISEDTYTIKAHASDRAGNLENTATLIIIFDKTIPEVQLSIDPSAPNGKRNWYITEPTITLSASDNHEVDKIEYQWNSSSGTWVEYAAPLHPQQGAQILYYRTKDLAGNYSEIGVKNVSYDKEPPKVSEFQIDRHGKDATVRWLQATDNVGIYEYEVIWQKQDGDGNWIDRQSVKVDKNTLQHTIQAFDIGFYRVRVRVEDLAGHTDTAQSKGLTIESAGAASSGGGGSEGAGVGAGGEVLGTSAGTSVGTGTGVGAGAGTGGALVGPALAAGQEGEVLGADNESQKEANTTKNEGQEGQVAGATTECSLRSSYLPAILLGTLFLLLLLLELILDTSVVIRLIIGVILASSMAIACKYLGDIKCVDEGSLMHVLYQWFLIPAVGLVGAVRLLAGMFIEDK